MQSVTLALAVLSSLITASWLIQYSTWFWPAFRDPHIQIQAEAAVLIPLQFSLPASSAIFFVVLHRTIRGLRSLITTNQAAYCACIVNGTAALFMALQNSQLTYPRGIGIDLPPPHYWVVRNLAVQLPMCRFLYFVSQDWPKLSTRRIRLTSCVLLLFTLYSNLKFVWWYLSKFPRTWATQGRLDWSARPLWTIWSYGIHPVLSILDPAAFIGFLFLLMTSREKPRPQVEAH